MGKKLPTSSSSKTKSAARLKSAPSAAASGVALPESSSSPARHGSAAAPRRPPAGISLDEWKRREAVRNARSVLESRFVKLSQAEIDQYRSVVAKRPFTRPIPPEAAVLPGPKPIDSSDATQAGHALKCPKRPKWKYYMSKKEVEKNESVMFDKWLAETEASLRSAASTSTGYFERNLDVWRQLWRVTEASTILLVLLDARCPLLHFPPALQDYLFTLRPRKGVILVLTKTDLVPAACVDEWTAYLTAQFGHPVVRAESYKLREAHEGTQGKQRKRFDPAAPENVRDALVDAIRSQHDMLMTAPERINPERRHLWKPHPSLRRNIDWEELRAEPKRPEASAKSKGKQRASDDQEVISKAEAKKNRRAERQEAVAKASRISSRASPTHRAPTQGARGSENPPGQRVHAELAHEQEREEEEGGDQSDPHEEEQEQEQAPFLSIGLIGQPNVGKSSLLNALLGRHVVRASRTPGKTKSLQTIYWTPTVRLVDCPGLVFPSAENGMQMQVLAGIIPVQNVEAVIAQVGERMPLERIVDVGELEDGETEWSTESLLAGLAFKKGFLTAKAARPDLYRAGSLVIRALHSSIIPWSFRPPTSIASSQQTVKREGIYLLPAENEDEIDRRQALDEVREEAEVEHEQTDGDEEEEEETGEGEQHESSDSEAVERSRGGTMVDAPAGSRLGGAFGLLAVDDGDNDDDDGGDQIGEGWGEQEANAEP